jgi:predicted DNA-binding transcriptional regulator AlpA
MNQPQPNNNDPLVKRPQMAAEIGISVCTLSRWQRDGLAPTPIRIGRTVGVPRSVLEAWKVEQGWPAAVSQEAVSEK